MQQMYAHGHAVVIVCNTCNYINSCIRYTKVPLSYSVRHRKREIGFEATGTAKQISTTGYVKSYSFYNKRSRPEYFLHLLTKK